MWLLCLNRNTTRISHKGQWSTVFFLNLCFDDSCRLDSCLGRLQLSSNQGELSEKVAITKTVLFIELAASSRALENTLRAEAMQWGSTDLAQITELDVMNCVTFNYACVYVFYWWRPASLSLSSLRKVSRKLKTFNTVCCYCCFYLLQKLKIWVGQSSVKSKVKFHIWLFPPPKEIVVDIKHKVMNT